MGARLLIPRTGSATSGRCGRRQPIDQIRKHLMGALRMDLIAGIERNEPLTSQRASATGSLGVWWGRGWWMRSASWSKDWARRERGLRGETARSPPARRARCGRFPLGQYSDDTQLAQELARSRVRQRGFDPAD